ncbi:dienelactone hydrolase [Microbacterium sp. SLBN-154]|uniref:dienelactone hydrolase family protein n=1 Tax=Microbacterium sp. SLBN-154 TaxID=2768458 RepID=UPI00114F0611|nr:dienelactone hydrolase family protein [Microbacterium sp. SLBN-154]TQK19984.1 dienelactone hydrolase [Microbacterium sp. SLBN-154]
MTDVVLFPSVLGVRPGVSDAADLLRDAGHDVVIVDVYDGRVFDDYDDAGRYEQSIGYPALMRRALDATRETPDGFFAAGFSNGAALAEYVATQRAVSGVLMLSGAIDVSMLGADSWPVGVNAQIHSARDDPFRDQAGIDTVVEQIRAAGGEAEIFDYEGTGHLFTDASLPREYDGHAAELLWSRALAFLTSSTHDR